MAGKLIVFSFTVLGSKKPTMLIPSCLHLCDSINSRKNDEKLNMQMSYNWRQMTTSEDTYIVHKLMIETSRVAFW